MKPTKYVLLATLACGAAAMAAFAQQKVDGEKWRAKVSMQAEGFTMPARTTEMCLPKERPEQAMMHQQSNEGNCAVSNFKQSGAKTSADIKCTGKEAMEGHIEMEQLAPNSMRGSMTGKTADATMKMEYEYTKLGQACQATDYSNYKPPAMPAIAKVDYCQKVFDDMGSGNLAGSAVGLTTKYPNSDGSGLADCTQHASFPKFCSAVQTPAGFAQLEYEQWNRRSIPAARNEEAMARMSRQPLTESMALCKLGNDQASVAKLQKRMADSALAAKQWGFLFYYDSATQYTSLQALAKKECSGRSFTNAANKDYLGLCSNYGTALVRDNRAGVLEAAGCSAEREDATHGICVGATSTGSGAMASMGGSAAAGGSSAASSSGSASAPAEAKAEEDDSAGSKAKDALNKGKKALRGIFGGG